jgi:hypothetical protein
MFDNQLILKANNILTGYIRLHLTIFASWEYRALLCPKSAAGTPIGQ